MIPGANPWQSLSEAPVPCKAAMAHTTRLEIADTGWQPRHAVVALCMLAVFIGYTDRVNISVAAVAMRAQFGWSQTTKGWVLAAFAMGYLLCMAFSGWLAHRFGGRRVLLVAVLWWSAFTLLTPFSAYQSLALLIAARIGLGIGESAVFPSSYELFSRCVPSETRARAIALLYSGVPLGQVAGLLGSAWVTARWGWPWAFYLFGAGGALWAILWVTIVREGTTDRSALPERRSTPTPWRALLTHPPVWAIVVGNFASNWCLYFFLAWLPSYFAEYLHLSLASAGLFSALPWLTAMASTNLSALAADRLAPVLGATAVRKVALSGGLLLCSLFLLFARHVHSANAALACICAASGALGITWTGYGPNVLDVAPRHASVVAGISNTVATLPGIVGVALVGWLVDTSGTYSAAFVLTAAVGLGGALFYLVFGSARPHTSHQART
jgi:MFS transporter, ACS family, solute carrier family 17 (sodium-dependent inorganic phosphate cotransporter), other